MIKLKMVMYAYVLCCFSCAQLFATSWTVTHQAPLSMEFSRQEHWNGLPFPPPGDLPDPGIEPTSLYVYSVGRRVLYNERYLGSLKIAIHLHN